MTLMDAGTTVVVMEEEPNQLWIFSLCWSLSPYTSQPLAAISALLPQRITNLHASSSDQLCNEFVAGSSLGWLSSQIPMVVTFCGWRAVSGCFGSAKRGMTRGFFSRSWRAFESRVKILRADLLVMMFVSFDQQ